MKILYRRSALTFVCIVIGTAGLWAASQWWEKALAKQVGIPTISPSGCYRIEQFRPFWILPSIFHLHSDPNIEISRKRIDTWNYPGFFRLYDNHSNALIGESDVYDMEFIGSGTFWDERTGEVLIGLILITPNVSGCLISTKPN